MAAAAAVARGAPLAIPRASGSAAAHPLPLLPRRRVPARPAALAAAALSSKQQEQQEQEQQGGSRLCGPLPRRPAGAARGRVRPRAAAEAAGEGASASGESVEWRSGAQEGRRLNSKDSPLNHPCLPPPINRPPLQSMTQNADSEMGGLAGLGMLKLALMFAGWYLANIYFNM
jgi:hypothetical protein